MRCVFVVWCVCAFSVYRCVHTVDHRVSPTALRHIVVLKHPKYVLFVFFCGKPCLVLPRFFPDINLFFWCLRYAEDFVAHAGNVNCIAIGRRTAKIVATGGDDCVVNIWGTGKPNCLHVRSCPTDCCLSRTHPALHVPRLYGVACLPMA